MNLRSFWELLTAELDRPFGRAEEMLDSVGAEEIGQGCFSTAYLVRFGTAKVVVKIAKHGREVNLPTEEELEENPVLRKRFLRPLFRPHRRAIIQPYAGESESRWYYKAKNMLRDAVEKASPVGSDHDCHGGNVGWFRRKLRIFDAMSVELREAIDNGDVNLSEDYGTSPSCYDSCPSVEVTGTPLSQRTKQETFC